MGKIRLPRRLSLIGLLGFAGLAAGCNQSDTEAMQRMGKKLAIVAGDIRENLGIGWESVYSGMGVESRVALRLHWDKNLADTSIQVKLNGNEIELTGTVQSQEQRRRALDVAESTTGVEAVKDLMVLVGT